LPFNFNILKRCGTPDLKDFPTPTKHGYRHRTAKDITGGKANWIIPKKIPGNPSLDLDSAAQGFENHILYPPPLKISQCLLLTYPFCLYFCCCQILTLTFQYPFSFSYPFFFCIFIIFFSLRGEGVGAPALTDI
jgi:hypothetical protein